MKSHKLSSPTSNFAALPENVGADASSTYVFTSVPAYEKKGSLLSASISSGFKVKRRIRVDLRPHLRQRSDDGAGNFGKFQHMSSPMEDFTSQEDEWSSLPTSFGKKRVNNPNRTPKRHQEYSANWFGSGNTDSEEDLLSVEPFDICLSRSRNSSGYKSLLRQSTKDKEIKMDNFVERTEEILRPGMVLLKNYVSLNDQVEIVKKCRELGLGVGGFYQPGYQDGAKLRLQMMCLGRNWDPQTKYEERQADGSDPPDIPHELIVLVKMALQDSHALIKNQDDTSNVEEVLPGMSPDICIVNFYTTSGRLGLHQDRDESQESLRKGLPVVSLSIGDSAEFLYGDKRNVEKAEKVLLESGDVLIFGGKSRHVFHGVKSITPRSAPSLLLKETMLRPGRLNLTFRQF